MSTLLDGNFSNHQVQIFWINPGRSRQLVNHRLKTTEVVWTSNWRMQRGFMTMEIDALPSSSQNHIVMVLKNTSSLTVVVLISMVILLVAMRTPDVTVTKKAVMSMRRSGWK